MINRILLAYDGSDNGRRALGVAAELSSKLKAELCIVHVLMHGRPAKELVHMAEVEHLVAEAEKALSPGVVVTGAEPYDVLSPSVQNGRSARVISAMGDLLVSYAKEISREQGAQVVRTTVRVGDYADEIIDAAVEMDADMVVMGSRGLGKMRGAVLGSVSQKVLHHAEQIVVTVKQG